MVEGPTMVEEEGDDCSELEAVDEGVTVTAAKAGNADVPSGLRAERKKVVEGFVQSRSVIRSKSVSNCKV